MSDNQLNSPANNQPANEKKESIQTKFQFILKTGGEQPATTDAIVINRFFTGNYAKVWAMKNGFFPRFKSFHEGELKFSITTDPRFKGNDFALSLWIANQYKTNVHILGNTINYVAEQFIAKDIIGYHVDSSIPREEMDALNKRVGESVKSLSKEPEKVHFGRIGRL